MKGRKITKWILCLLCVLGFVFPVVDASAGVALNYFYDLNDGASTPPPGWIQGGGGAAQRVGTKLESGAGTIIYSMDVPADVAVSIEAVVSAGSLGGVGDRGTRLWLVVGDALTLEHRLIGAHLEEVAGGSKIVLRDAYGSTPKGEIDLDWTMSNPAVRVRLKRQNIGGIDYVVLQGEVSKTGPGASAIIWDDPANPNPDPDTSTSIKVPVSDFVSSFFAFNQVGFGNADPGIYDSSWEYIHVTVAGDAFTVLPYWPAQPPAPALTLTTTNPPHEVSSQVHLPIGGYLVNDSATLLLDTLSGKLSSTPIPDPSAAPAQHIATFAGLAGDQTVTGWVEIADASGRTSIGPSASIYLPPSLQVSIDIKPGGFPNSINPRSEGNIPVAILTTDTFDGATVDPTTVHFGRSGTEAAPVHFSLQDVDRDGDIDIIFHFNIQDTGIKCGDSSASLTGETIGGQMIEASDSIKPVGCE